MLPFYDNKDDTEMVHLLHFLKTIKDEEDVRPILSNTFHLSKLREPHILEKIEGVIEYEVQQVTDEDLILAGVSEVQNQDSISDT
jgi:hypothetical protein